ALVRRPRRPVAALDAASAAARPLRTEGGRGTALRPAPRARARWLVRRSADRAESVPERRPRRPAARDAAGRHSDRAWHLRRLGEHELVGLDEGDRLRG